MKIVLWIGDEENQCALASKISKQFEVVGIVLERRVNSTKRSSRDYIEAIIERLFLSSIRKAWWGMKNRYGNQFPTYPDVPNLIVENINSVEAFNFTKSLAPSLIVVSGTRLVKKHMFTIQPQRGIINLHTGLSPYIKGGPNCTNWCVATKQFHLIGNTVMWIDEGIDSGNLISTELTDLSEVESLSDLHWIVMEHAHDLYIRSIEAIQNNKASNVNQDTIAVGKTYYSKEWTLKQKINLVRNFKYLIKTKSRIDQDRLKVNIVQL